MLYIDLILLVFGVLMYALGKEKNAEIGRILFAVALLAFLLGGRVPFLR